MPCNGVPPGTEPTSFVDLVGGLNDTLDEGLEAPAVLGSIGVVSGCDIPGDFEEMAEGTLLGESG